MVRSWESSSWNRTIQLEAAVDQVLGFVCDGLKGERACRSNQVTIATTSVAATSSDLSFDLWNFVLEKIIIIIIINNFFPSNIFLNIKKKK